MGPGERRGKDSSSENCPGILKHRISRGCSNPSHSRTFSLKDRFSLENMLFSPSRLAHHPRCYALALFNLDWCQRRCRFRFGGVAVRLVHPLTLAFLQDSRFSFLLFFRLYFVSASPVNECCRQKAAEFLPKLMDRSRALPSRSQRFFILLLMFAFIMSPENSLRVRINWRHLLVLQAIAYSIPEIHGFFGCPPARRKRTYAALR